jgi:hypothetical protein
LPLNQSFERLTRRRILLSWLVAEIFNKIDLTVKFFIDERCVSGDILYKDGEGHEMTERKQFFFEKNNPKTSAPLRADVTPSVAYQKNQSFFCFFFVHKKEVLPSLCNAS